MGWTSARCRRNWPRFSLEPGDSGGKQKWIESWICQQKWCILSKCVLSCGKSDYNHATENDCQYQQQLLSSCLKAVWWFDHTELGWLTSKHGDAVHVTCPSALGDDWVPIDYHVAGCCRWIEIATQKRCWTS